MKARVFLSTVLAGLLLMGLVLPVTGQGNDGAADATPPGPSLEEQLKLGLITQEQYDQALRELDATTPGCCGAEDYGGPDPFGYYFIDSDEPSGPAYSWIDIAATGTPIPFAYDTVHGPYPLGLTFSFYGNDYSQVWISSEGWVSVLSATASDYSNDCPLPSTNGQGGLLAAFWDDRGPSAGPYGSGFYQSFAAGSCPYPGYAGACFVAEWLDMPLYGTPADLQTFEAVLFDNGDMLVQILESGTASGTSATTGIENETETIGLTYGCNTAGYLHDELAILFYLPVGPNLNDSYKAAPGAVEIGTPIDYTIVISNTGSGPAADAAMEDPIPPGVTFVPGSVSCTGGTCWYDDLADTVFWQGQVEVDEEVTVQFSVDTSGLGCGSAVLNEATITDAALPGPVVVQASTEAWLAVWLAEDFEADVFPPPGWVEAHDPAGMAWTDQDLEPRGNLTGGSGKFAIVDDDYGGSAALTVAELWMPPIDIPEGFSTYLVFKTDYNNISSNESANVDISLDGGSSWTTLQHWNTDHRGPLTASVDLSAYAGSTGAILRFFYDDGDAYAWWWEIDDVQIVSCEPPPDVEISPTELSATLCTDDQEVQELTICNVGGQPLDWELSEPANMGFAQDIGYISDNFVTFPLDDFSGQTVIGTTTNVYYGIDFDPTATVLYALNDTTDELGTIDLATGAFTGLVPCPAPVDIWTGLTIDPESGDFYASTATDLYTIDPNTGVYTLVGPFGTSLMIEVAMNSLGQMYGHDIGTDSIYQIDPATGAATLIGPTGYAANYAQGMDFDNADGTLYIWLYIGSGANVYGIVNLATGAVTPLAVDSPLGEFEGATQTVVGSPSGIPWLSEDPTSGTVAPGDCQTVNVTFDSTGLEPDVYTGELSLSSNDPDEPAIVVPVTLVVDSCGDLVFATHVRILKLPSRPLLLGIVRAATGDGSTPVPGATVDVTWTIPPGPVLPQTRTTNANGLAFPLMLTYWPGTYTLDLVNITAAGFAYDPNLNWESSASITLP